MRTVAAAALFLLAPAACSGRQISSWSPSGSLDWDRPPAAESDEAPDGGAGDGTEVAADGAPGPEDPAAALARADRNYAAGDLAAARSGYGVAFAAGSREQQLHALHRMAWCDQHEGRVGAGVDRLLQLLALTDPPRDDDERARRREAIRDLATFEALRADRTADRTIAEIERALPAPEERAAALARLAEQYEAGGRTAEAEATRVRLRATSP